MALRRSLGSVQRLERPEGRVELEPSLQPLATRWGEALVAKCLGLEPQPEKGRVIRGTDDREK